MFYLYILYASIPSFKNIHQKNSQLHYCKEAILDLVEAISWNQFFFPSETWSDHLSTDYWLKAMQLKLCSCSVSTYSTFYLFWEHDTFFKAKQFFYSASSTLLPSFSLTRCFSLNYFLIKSTVKDSCWLWLQYWYSFSALWWFSWHFWSLSFYPVLSIL